MQRILILFAHPAIENSRVQYRLRQAVSDLAQVTVHDLYETYADFMLDAKQEQRLLIEHDIIVFQHPFYWYSTPAVLKEWQDIVLEQGFAYGEQGTALQGKGFFNALSAGGAFEAYRNEGSNQFSVRDFLTPFAQTATLCGMHYLPPFVVHDAMTLSEAQLDQYTQHYCQTLLRLQQQDASQWGELASLRYLNDWKVGEASWDY